jgi:PBP1b-binding outer membrane lipoprotein LpoB
MKKKLFTIVLFMMMILSGCGQPQFNPNYRYVKFMNGKPYSMPYAVNFRNMPVDAKMASELREIGIPCRKGNLLWYTRDLSSKMRNLKTEDDMKQMTYSFYHAGKLRCEHPLNKQEYTYRMNQMNQQSANNRVTAQNNAMINAAATPRSYNINHTGSIYHYGY